MAIGNLCFHIACSYPACRNYCTRTARTDVCQNQPCIDLKTCILQTPSYNCLWNENSNRCIIGFIQYCGRIAEICKLFEFQPAWLSLIARNINETKLSILILYPPFCARMFQTEVVQIISLILCTRRRESWIALPFWSCKYDPFSHIAAAWELHSTSSITNLLSVM